MVLVDSSIWIGYFSKGLYDELSQLINEDLVVTNDVILSELIPFLEHANAFEAVSSLRAFEKIPMSIDWEGIRLLQKLNLESGINRVGIPDLLILQNVIFNNLTLWTNDKHFNLMAQNVELKLFVNK